MNDTAKVETKGVNHKPWYPEYQCQNKKFVFHDAITAIMYIASIASAPAMVAMAELYYWGQRGFARDHARVRRGQDVRPATPRDTRVR